MSYDCSVTGITMLVSGGGRLAPLHGLLLAVLHVAAGPSIGSTPKPALDGECILGREASFLSTYVSIEAKKKLFFLQLLKLH